MKMVLFAALIATSAMAQAHEVWIERDGAGPARIYLGEPAEAPPPGGDPEFAKLKAPHVLSAPNAAQQRKAGFIEVAVPPGDVRAWDDDVFASWGDAGKKENVVYYARAGRTDTRAALPLELAPVTAGGDRFVLVRDGKPVPATGVTIVTPSRKTVKQTTDAAGIVTVRPAEKGRYLIGAAIRDANGGTTPAGPVQVLHRITTTSYVVG